MRTSEAKWNETRKHWRISVQKNGQRKDLYSSVSGKKGKIAAEKAADEWLNAVEEEAATKELRFGEAYKLFIEAKKRECGTAWVNKLDSVGKTWLLPKLEHKLLTKIYTQDCKDCLLNAYELGRSRKTIEDIRGVVTNFYTFCEDAGIECNQIRKLAIPKDAPVGTRKIIQPEQLKVLMSEDCITHYNKDVFCWYIHAWRLMVLLGLRRGECCGIKREDIDGDVLHIRRSINSENEITTGKTKSARRDIYLPDRAKLLLISKF